MTLPAPYYQQDGATIYCGDCREILPELERACAIVTDPPYGIDACSQTLGMGKKKFFRGDWDGSRPMWIADFLEASTYCCIWGGNYFSDMLPPTNHWLIWHKKNDGRSFSECEMAWTNFGRQCRHLSHHWGGEEKGHPTQKPLTVMRWCITQAPTDARTILDPFMGSGTTILAALMEGRTATGIELEEKYCEIAANRLRAWDRGVTLKDIEQGQASLFD